MKLSRRFLRAFTALAALVLVLTACGRVSAQADQTLYGPWQFSGVSYQESGQLKTSTVNGDIDLGQDGKCRGTRYIGRIAGSLDGPYTAQGKKLTFSAESDVTYTWQITEGDIKGVPVWILALDNGSMTYQLVRKRGQ